MGEPKGIIGETLTVNQRVFRGRTHEDNRVMIAQRLDSANPKFGINETPVGGISYGRVKLANGGEVIISNGGPASVPFRVALYGRAGDALWQKEYQTEEEAVAMQKKLYERETKKIRKKYNL